MSEIEKPVVIRPATPQDLDDVMCVEVETFSELGEEAMAPR